MNLTEKRKAEGIPRVNQKAGKKPRMYKPECGAFEEPTPEKEAVFKKNFLIKTPLARISKPEKRGGRSKKKTPRQMMNGINNYFNWCEANDRVPSIKGMMLHMKLLRDVFYKYIQQPEYADILEQAKIVISEWVENDIYRTPGQAAGKIAYAKNIHGWADKIDTTSVNETKITQVLTVEGARAKIASLAHLIDPELLENLARPYITDQITIDAELVPAKG